MVKNTALAVALMSCLPLSALAQSACGGPRELTVCENELYDAGVVWEGRAHEERIRLRGCLDKLRVRTSTAMERLFVPPEIPPEPSLKHDLVLMAAAGVTGLGFGLLLGILLN